MAEHISTLSSMTGFARQDGQYPGYQWVWELRSVNGRGLEIRFRLPFGFDELEARLRKVLTERLHRGSLHVSLTLRQETGATRLRLNEQALDDVIHMIKKIETSDLALSSSSAEGILNIRGVVEVQEENLIGDDRRRDLLNTLTSSFDTALTGLERSRHQEGASLQPILKTHIDNIAALTHHARQQVNTLSEKLHKKLETQVMEFSQTAGITQERLVQEVALMVVKADIREELDRLDAHIAASLELINDQGPIGRRFDFLVQEFNREANTLCSKAADLQLKQTGLELKTVIDQLREQVQNIE